MNDTGLPAMPDASDVSGKIIRIAVQTTGIVLIAVGVIYLLDVFSRVRAVVSDPQGLQALTSGFAQQIDADKIVVPTAGEPVPIGKSIALGMALLWHILFAWIPLAILAAGGKLISWTLADARHTREAIMQLAARAPNRDRPRALDLSTR